MPEIALETPMVFVKFNGVVHFCDVSVKGYPVTVPSNENFDQSVHSIGSLGKNGVEAVTRTGRL